MAMVNNLCSWVRRYLRGYVGMDLKYLKSYLTGTPTSSGSSATREVAQSGKGAPPFVHGRREFPQLEEAR